MDLSEQEPELRESIINFAYTWSRTHFQQDEIQIHEVAELPTIYADNIFGYRAIISTPAHPHGEFIDVLVSAKKVIIGAKHIVEWREKSGN